MNEFFEQSMGHTHLGNIDFADGLVRTWGRIGDHRLSQRTAMELFSTVMEEILLS